MTNWDWSIDGWIVLTAILCSVSAALLGNFLVLRRMSLLGDAISHAILPGLAIAFLISQSRDSFAMFIGAVVVGILTAFLTQWLQREGKVDEGASMGVVFTTLFSIGLVLIERFASVVDLDPDCVLYGAIEQTTFDTANVAGFEVPTVVLRLSVILILNIAFILFFFKELRLAAFDPALADSLGFPSIWIHYGLMVLVAITTVASFESVGNILVVAMLIVPPSTALLLSSRLPIVILWSVAVAALSAVAGHLGAISIPPLFGLRSTTTAGMMAVASGTLFLLASIFAPHKGVLMRWLVRQRLAFRILREDTIAAIYRWEEWGNSSLSQKTLADLLLVSRWTIRSVCWWLSREGSIRSIAGSVSLTSKGQSYGRELVRTHRLWENYLVETAGNPREKIHMQAERLEHFTDRELQNQLSEAISTNTIDPHGRKIPPPEPS